MKKNAKTWTKTFTINGTLIEYKRAECERTTREPVKPKIKSTAIINTIRDRKSKHHVPSHSDIQDKHVECHRKKRSEYEKTRQETKCVTRKPFIFTLYTLFDFI